jgi:tetratricopeptide (TPR) repeat protein
LLHAAFSSQLLTAGPSIVRKVPEDQVTGRDFGRTRTRPKGSVKRESGSTSGTGSKIIACGTDRMAAFWIVLVAMLCGAFVAYLPSLSGPFLFDDLGLPFAQPNAANQTAGFWIGGVRPVLMASYWLNFISSGTNSVGYHVVNLGLHALAAALVYVCAVNLLTRAGIDDSRLRALAVLTAGLFLLHPLQTESSAYIAGRSEVLAGVFFFAGFATFLRTPSAKISYRRAIGILAMFGAALLSKENTVVLPALLILTGFFWSSDGIAGHLRQFARLYGALLVMGAAASFFVLRLLANAPTAGFHVPGVTWFDYLLTQCRVVPIYLLLFVAPIRQCADWALAFSHNPMDQGAALYGLGILAALLPIFHYRRRTPLLCYGLLVFFLLLAPTSSVIPIKDALAERRMYLPIFGLALALSAALAILRLSGTALKATVSAILIVAAGASYLRSEVWSDDLLFWRDVVRNSPSNLRGFEAMGQVLSLKKRCADAIPVYKKALSLSDAQNGKDKAVIQISLASAYVCNNEQAKAREMLRAMTSSEEAAVMFTELGVAAAKANAAMQASQDFGDAILQNPKYAPAYAYRGLLEQAASEDPEAEHDFRRALELDPGNVFAADGLKGLARPR